MCHSNVNSQSTGSYTFTIDQPTPSGATGAVSYSYNAFSGGSIVPVSSTRMITVGVPSETTVFIVATDSVSGSMASCSFTVSVTAQVTGKAMQKVW